MGRGNRQGVPSSRVAGGREGRDFEAGSVTSSTPLVNVAFVFRTPFTQTQRRRPSGRVG